MNSLQVFRYYIYKLLAPVIGVAARIRKILSELETSNEPVRTFYYVRHLGLQRYERGMKSDTLEWLLHLFPKIYANIDDDCRFRTNKLESTFCNNYGHTTNNDGVCIDWSLHLEHLSLVQPIIGMLYQLMDSRGEYLENYRYVDDAKS